MPQDVGLEPVEAPWFFKDFDVFLNSAVGAINGGSQIPDGVVTFGPSWDFIDQEEI